jgi:malonate decarboxylase gamma subunit
MTLDEVLKGLFPSGHDVKTSQDGLITGTGKRKQGDAIAVIGVAHGVALGTAGVLPLAEEVLQVVARGAKRRFWYWWILRASSWPGATRCLA